MKRRTPDSKTPQPGVKQVKSPAGRERPPMPPLGPEFKELEEKGYQVVPSLIDEPTLATLRSDMWDFYEGLGTGIDRNDPGTWATWLSVKDRTFRWPPVLHGGLLQRLGCGQSRVAWKVRAHKKVQEVFLKLWQEEDIKDMLVSFDGINLGRPWQLMGRKRAPKHNDCLHSDQAPCKQDGADGRGWCVQGQVNLNPMPTTASTFYCLEGSHKLWNQFCQERERKRPSADWQLLTDEEVKWFEDRGCPRTRVHAPAGSLILWKSNTIHQGCGPAPDCEDVQRMVVYVCMTPRRLAKGGALVKKRKHFKMVRSCNHVPHESNMFSKGVRWGKSGHMTRHVDNAWVLEDPVLRRLAGFD